MIPKSKPLLQKRGSLQYELDTVLPSLQSKCLNYVRKKGEHHHWKTNSRSSSPLFGKQKGVYLFLSELMWMIEFGGLVWCARGLIWCKFWKSVMSIKWAFQFGVLTGLSGLLWWLLLCRKCGRKKMFCGDVGDVRTIFSFFWNQGLDVEKLFSISSQQIEGWAESWFGNTSGLVKRQGTDRAEWMLAE